MKTKKIAQATAIAAIAAAAWLGTGMTNASAAESEPSPSPTVTEAPEIQDNGITIDDISFNGNQMYVDGGKASEVIVGVGTEKDGKVKISSWDVHENIYKDAEFDIEAVGYSENYGNGYEKNRYYNQDFKDSKAGKLLERFYLYDIKTEESNYSPDPNALDKEEAACLGRWMQAWLDNKNEEEIIETFRRIYKSDDEDFYGDSIFSYDNQRYKRYITEIIDYLNKFKYNSYDIHRYANWAKQIYEQELHCYYYKGIPVDLSKLNPVKDNCIAVKTEASDPIYIKIPASVKKQKVTFHVNSLDLDITSLKGGTSSSVKDYTWEYRTSSGNWTDIPFKDNGTIVPDFNNYLYQGASLYIRAASTLEGYKDIQWINELQRNAWISTTFFNISSDEVTDASDKDGTKKYPMYTTRGSLPGKESKVNIPKQANGPSVGVDYAKGTVKIPKNTEYRVLADGEYLCIKDEYSITYHEAKDTINADVTSLFTYKDENGVEHTSEALTGTLEVRKFGSAKGKGKAPSKWTIIPIEKPVALTLSEANKKDTSVATGSSVSLVSATGGAISADYQAAKKPAKGYKVTYANFSLTTTSDITYEYILSTDGTNKPAANARAAKLTSKKAANIKKAKADGNYLWVRIAGDRKTKTWAGEYTNLGRVTFPEDEEYIPIR